MSANIMQSVLDDLTPFRTTPLAHLVLAVVHAAEAETAYYAAPEAHDDLADIRVARALREARADLIDALISQGIASKQAAQMAEALV